MRNGFLNLIQTKIFFALAMSACMALGFWLGHNYNRESQTQGILAETKIGPVTEMDLIQFVGSDWYDSEKAVYLQKKSQIEDYLKTKISKEFDPNLNLDQVSLTDQEVDSAISEAKLDRKKMSEKDYRNFYDNLKLAKAKQKRAEDIKKSYDDLQVRFKIKPPQFQKVQINPGAGQILGSSRAPIEIISLSSSHCAQCKIANGQITRLQNEFGDRLRISLRYRGYDNEDSLPFLSAEANLCAGLQRKFWDFYHSQLESPPQGFGQIQEIAKKLGLNEKDFGQCMQDRRFKNQILEDQKVSNSLASGIEPLLVINGSLVSGLENLSLLSDLIRSELK